MQTTLHQELVIGIILLNAYSCGANCVERFVNYQTWPLIAVDSFKAYHKAQQPLIQSFVVAPVAIGFLLQVWLVWDLPVGVAPAVAWVMLIASAVGAVSTVALQLPIHAAFNQSGYSPALMRRLLWTDWFRKAADVARLAATAVLLHQIVRVR
jgi:hypothetical protein